VSLGLSTIFAGSSHGCVFDVGYPCWKEEKREGTQGRKEKAERFVSRKLIIRSGSSGAGTLQIGDYVACERAMAGHTRFGGHMVQVRSSRSAQLAFPFSRPYLIARMLPSSTVSLSSSFYLTSFLSTLNSSIPHIGPRRYHRDHHLPHP
jgi:hypothetical protein